MKILADCEFQDAVAEAMERRLKADRESRKGEAMFEVPYGQDPYNAIGDYIEDHITVIEDIIATIEVDGIKTNQLLMVDMKPDHYFVWDNDWWEGEKNVALIDFFPVSEAQKSSVERKNGKWIKKMRVTETEKYISYEPEWYCACCGTKYDSHIAKVVNFCYVCGVDMRGRKEE